MLILKQCVQLVDQSALGNKAYRLVNDLAALDEQHRRHAAHTEHSCQFGTLVDVGLANHGLALKIGYHFLNDRCQCLARAAPRGSKVKEDGKVCLLDLSEIIVINFYYHSVLKF